jgi:SAM-dependent MidA family methyltransferase
MQDTGETAMPFREWMRQALFDPDTGYYTTNVRTVGRRGDFSTSATAGTLLAEAVAGWLRAEMRRQPGVRAVIEVGGGSGVLSHVVRRSLGWWNRLKLRWHMVEASPVLRDQQREKLGRGAATWHESMASAMTAADGQAFVFHHELVDAFPVTLLKWDEPMETWREIWMRQGEGGWREELGVPVAGGPETGTNAANLEASVLSREGWPKGAPRQGQRVEVHWSYQEWMESWAMFWSHGSMLTIDYGDIFPGIYHRRPGGTLRAYFAQQRLTDAEVYQRMGKQDITADVNFTDLQGWGAKLGWSTETLETQTQFIRRHVGDALERSRKEAADAYVLDPEGAGGAFKALVQHAPLTGVPAS